MYTHTIKKGFEIGPFFFGRKTTITAPNKEAYDEFIKNNL